MGSTVLKKIASLRKNRVEQAIYDTARIFEIPCDTRFGPGTDHGPVTRKKDAKPNRIKNVWAIGPEFLNILDADGTLLLSDTVPERNLRWVDIPEIFENHPFLLLSLYEGSGLEAVIKLTDWLIGRQIRYLNVVVLQGGSSEPMARAVRMVLGEMLVRCQRRDFQGHRPLVLENKMGIMAHGSPPRSVDEAAEMVLTVVWQKLRESHRLRSVE